MPSAVELSFVLSTRFVSFLTSVAFMSPAIVGGTEMFSSWGGPVASLDCVEVVAWTVLVVCLSGASPKSSELDIVVV